MILAAPLLLLAFAQGTRADTARADSVRADSARADTARAHTNLLAAPLDTPVVRRRPRAIEYSDLYYTRLTIHRYASYTMLPMFAAEYALGQNLMQDASPAQWMRPAHAVVAGGVGVLFGLNTITGGWNLWESRQDPNGRTKRLVHSVLMLASDGGFALAGALAPGHHRRYSNYSDYLSRERLHRNVAIGSFALSTVGAAMMWFWK